MPYADDLDNAAFDDPSFYTPEGHWTETYAYGERGFRLADANMGRLMRLCRAHGISATIVVYPWRTNIAHGERDHIHARYWRAFASEQGVRFIDLFPAFTDEGPAAQQLFIEDDVHWNERGHAFVAAHVLPHLE